jgi:hypothetical protein
MKWATLYKDEMRAKLLHGTELLTATIPAEGFAGLLTRHSI